MITNSANDINQVKNTTNKAIPASTNNTSNLTISKTIPQKIKGAVDNVLRVLNSDKGIMKIINSNKGFVKLSDGKVVKQIDAATKAELYNSLKYLEKDTKLVGTSKIQEAVLDKLLEKYKISPDKSVDYIKKRIIALLDKTKTK
jgi:myosin-crossreactive antigen